MNNILLAPRRALQSLTKHRLASITTAAVFALMIGSSSVFAEDTTANDAQACSTSLVKMDVSARGTAVVYGTADGGTSGTLFVADIPLSSIRNITDAERASGEKIWITSYDSTIIAGWHVDIYWQNEHYGAYVTSSEGFIADTGAVCIL